MRPGGDVAGSPGAGAGVGTSPGRAGAGHLKKSVGHFRPPRVSDMYAAIDQIAGRDLSTAAVCTTLDLSRSAYYAWRSGEPSSRASRDEELAPLVRAIFWKHRRRYGTRRIASELLDLGQRLSPRRVWPDCSKTKVCEPFSPSRSCRRPPIAGTAWGTVPTCCWKRLSRPGSTSCGSVTS